MTEKRNASIWHEIHHLVPPRPSHPSLGTFHTYMIAVSQVFNRILLLFVAPWSSFTLSTNSWGEITYFFQSPSSLDQLYPRLSLRYIWCQDNNIGLTWVLLVFQKTTHIQTRKRCNYKHNKPLNILICSIRHPTLRQSWITVFHFLITQENFCAPAEQNCPQSHGTGSLIRPTHPYPSLSEFSRGPSQGD